MRHAQAGKNVKVYRDAGALADEVLDGLDGSADTGVIGDGLAIKGDVEVAADQDLRLTKRCVSRARFGGCAVNMRRTCDLCSAS